MGWVLWASVPADLLMTGEPSPTGAFELIQSLVEAALCTSRGVVLEVLRREPLGYLRAATENTWRQLWEESEIVSSERFLRR